MSTLKLVLGLQDLFVARRLVAFIAVLYTFKVLWSAIYFNVKLFYNVL